MTSRLDHICGQASYWAQSMDGDMMIRNLMIAAFALVATACQQAPMSDEDDNLYTGYLRRGFEHADFYPADNPAAGPWWVSVAESQFPKLDVHARGEGRGRMIVVRLTVRATEAGPVDFGFRPPFANSLEISEVLDVEPVSDEAFNAIVEASRKAR